MWSSKTILLQGQWNPYYTPVGRPLAESRLAGPPNQPLAEKEDRRGVKPNFCEVHPF